MPEFHLIHMIQAFSLLLCVKRWVPPVLLAPPAPSSEREVIIPTPAKWLVKSPGKTELTCVELNLKTVDGMLLLSLGACQLAFAALASVPWEVGFGPR